ncbi:MAG: hypothetical protein GXO08_01335 [Aquificae bacterium]|nr:hypothetical protein [Aquificota bacterium]
MLEEVHELSGWAALVAALLLPVSGLLLWLQKKPFYYKVHKASFALLLPPVFIHLFTTDERSLPFLVGILLFTSAGSLGLLLFLVRGFKTPLLVLKLLLTLSGGAILYYAHQTVEEYEETLELHEEEEHYEEEEEEDN